MRRISLKIIVCLLLPAALAAAQEVTGLGTHHEPSRSVDLVFIGDGFTLAEKGEYEKIIDRMAANFTTPPFNVHADRVNIHRVFLESKQSGIRTDANPVEPPLGGTVAKFVGGKLLRCDVPKVVEVARRMVPDVDYILVVLNTHGKFLGSANTGRIVRLSTSGGHQRSIVVHEFGHNFVGLVDEYVDTKQAGAGAIPPRIKFAINADLSKNVYLAKWHHWNIPEDVFRGRKRGKSFKWEDNVRCYEGGATFPDGVYRAEENCHMQRGRGKAFCRVCAEAMELGLYRFFAPIESVTPARFDVARKPNTDFAVRTVVPARVAWYVDGRRVPDRKMKAKNGAYTLRLRKSELKDKRWVTVTVSIDSPRVHMDRGRLSASFTWTLDERERSGIVATPVEPDRPGAYWFNGRPFVVKPEGKRSNKGPKFDAIPDQTGREGEKLEFQLPATDPDRDHLLFTSKSLPDGATLDANTGAFAWEVGHTRRGDYEISFQVTDGKKKARRRVRIRIEGTAMFRGIFKAPETEYRGIDRQLVGLHHPNAQVRERNVGWLRDAPQPTAFAEALRLLRDRNPQLVVSSRRLLEELVKRAPLDMFLDEMPRRVWQFVDRPKLLTAVRDLIATALKRSGLSRKDEKALKALQADLDAIDRYNEERREKPAPPPITDKKYR